MIELNKFGHTISTLTNEILKYNDQNPDLFLGAGALANSLFYFKLSRYTKEEFYIDKALSEFEKTYNRIDKVAIIDNMNLVSGYAGIAWLYQYYVNQNLIEYDSDFLLFFDELIINECRKDQVQGRYDLFYGIIGYGSYFLQRSKFDKNCADRYLDEITSLLTSMSIKDSIGTYWFSDMFSDEKNKVNIGMAHGLPSIISFLTKVYSINKNKLAKEMMIESANWLLQFKCKNKNSPSMFPYLVNKESLEVPLTNTTRLAWCYGDLTIGYVIYVLGQTIDNEYYINQGLEVLKSCGRRKIEEPVNGVRDKGFCHGTSGIYYIFKKLSFRYGLIEFEEAQKYWFEKTLINLDESIECLKAYTIVNGKMNFAHDYGLINGYPGIGIALLSSIYMDSNEWDEIFML